MKITRALVTILFVGAFLYGAIGSGIGKNLPDPYADIYTTEMVTDTVPIKDNYGDHITDPNNNPFDIQSNVIDQKVEYDPITGNYIIYEKIGEEYYRTPTYLTFEEYLEFKKKKQQRDYFNRLAGISSKKSGLNAKIDPMERIDVQNSLVDRLFGGTEVNIQPQGQVDVTLQSTYWNSFQAQFGGNGNGVQFIPIDPEVDIRVSTEGNIGTKLNLDFNYDTQSTFDFDRQIKLDYDTEAFGEDDIIKKIEAGNVSLPLRGNLIQGAQSLFGLKTELQFGHLRLTAIASQQQSEQNNLRIENGAAVQEFELTPDEYDENRHFFISHYNRETFEQNLERMPQIATAFRVSQLEVWISDDARQNTRTRSTPIVAFADLGESDLENYTNKVPGFEPPTMLSDQIFLDRSKNKILPDNRVNPIYERIVTNEDNLPEFEDVEDYNKVVTLLEGQGFESNTDFAVFEGRKLSQSEFTYNEQLGMLSLNIRLRPSQNLAVAYNYTFTENCDEIYNVGNLSADGSKYSPQTRSSIPGDTSIMVEPAKVLFTKLLKSNVQQTNKPTWDLMMKNVYPLRATTLDPKEFSFDIFYEDDSDGSLKKFIPEAGFRNKPLLQVFNLDNLNKYNDPQADGVFDFVPGVTVIPSSGSVVFPVLEPFGSSLDSLLVGIDPATVERYKFQELYDTSVTIARLSLEKNKFLMMGEVTAATSGEINLGPFVPEGSVRVRAGGVLLQEGSDYEVDYSIGRLRIINESYLQQGTPINVSFEDQALFSLQQKNMIGLRADYDFNDNFSLGATYLRLSERPFTQKVNIGNDPIRNRVFGLDMAYSNEAPFITKLVDKLPFYSTKEKSSINFSAEAAYLRPGHSKAININGEDDSGVVSIDDFEGAVSGLLLGGFNTNQWRLASTPTDGRFPESTLSDSLLYGVNRAKLAWYSIDRQARNQADFTNPYTRLIDQEELFNRDVQVGQSELLTFDISYFPEERGPYNFDLPGGTPVSQGITPGPNGEILLNEPKSRWGGIMRNFQNTDFEAANYEFIEFWMLNPYMDRPDGAEHDPFEEGEIVFHLGNVSEDIIKDGNQLYENTLPLPDDNVTAVINTNWGKVSQVIPVANGFDIENSEDQDVGFDGINDRDEQIKHIKYLDDLLINNFSTDVQRDPSGDNYEFIEASNSTADLLTRFKNFNNPEGNAPIGANQTTGLQRGNRFPESEDLNNNRSLDQGEGYYKYTVKIKRMEGTNGPELDTDPGPGFTNFITQDTTIARPDGQPDEKWYRFRIPITNGWDTKVGSISGFRAIQFMRMYMTEFSTPKTFRLADFQLVRNLWRRSATSCGPETDPNNVNFSVDEVGVEENSKKQPFGYVTPKNIQQEQLFSTFANLLQDEKSLSLNFENLEDGCEIGINKLARLDLTQYEKLQLFMHCEADEGEVIPDQELYGYIRFGKDLVDHYYEYEIPLQPSEFATGSDQEIVWPDTNFIDVKFDDFIEAKKERIIKSIPNNEAYPFITGLRENATIYVKGTPSLGYIKTFEIGVRNKAIEGENGEAYSGEVWVNELRATGLNEQGGLAAQARMQVQMADLGEINLAANYSTIGWGGIDQRLAERNREELLQYDVATSLQLGKFFPSDWGINIPFYAQYSKNNAYRQFEPYERDLTVDQKVEAVEARAARNNEDPTDEIREIKDRSKETSTIKTFNFTNVKKDGQGKMPWSISNFSTSYSYTETTQTDPIIRSDKTKEQTLTLDYNYGSKLKPIQPFKKVKNKYLKIVKEFNFNPLPKSFTFSTNVNRLTNSREFRLPDAKNDPVFKFDDRRFLWDRNYGLNWDFSKALKFTFKAQASSIVDELRRVGIQSDRSGIDDRLFVDQNGNERDENGQLYTDLINANPSYVDDYRNQNLQNLGRSRGYKHNVGLQYTLPIRYLPFLQWITVKTDYKADYAWTAGSLITIDNIPSERYDNGTPLGNIIQNNQTRSVNGTFSFDKLYSKSKYLKKIEKGNKKRRSSRNRKSTAKSKTPSKSGKKNAKDEKKKDRDVTLAERILIRPLLSLRSIKATYKEQLGTLIPGFMPNAELLGLNSGFGAPGWQFAAGLQPTLKDPIEPADRPNWLKEEDHKTWFNPSGSFNSEISQRRTQNIDLRIALEPFKDFDIDIDFKKTYTIDQTQVLTNKGGDLNDPSFVQQALYDVGSFDLTNLGFATLFDNRDSLYSAFQGARKDVSLALATADFNNPDNLEAATALDIHSEDFDDFKKGYGPNNYDVSVPAFLNTYLGTDNINSYTDLTNEVSALSYLPSPNWTVKYDGLSKIKMFKDVLSSFTLNHAYKGSMRVNRFNTTLEYRAGQNSISPVNDNYYSRIQIPVVEISDQFSPLIGLSLKTKSEMSFEAEWRKSRSLGLSLEDLREQTSSEIRVGFGYTIKNFGGSKKKKKGKRRKKDQKTAKKDDKKTGGLGKTGRNGGVKNNRGKTLTMNLDFSITDTKDYIYEVSQGIDPRANSGQRSTQFSPSVDYDINENLTMRFFYDYNFTRSAVTSAGSNKRLNMRGGVTAQLKIN